MKTVKVMFLVIVFWFSSISTAYGETEDQTVMQLLSTSNDYLDLVREYWPKIGNGDVLPMTVSYEALNICGNFKDEISAADNVDDLETLLHSRRSKDVEFAKGIYFKCKRLVEHYAEFPGWAGLVLRAALAGDIRSKSWMAIHYYQYKNERPREDFPYSPGAFLTESMAAGHPIVFQHIAAYGPHFDILQDNSQTTVIAWWLLSCKYRHDCDRPESLQPFCALMTAECATSDNLLDLYRQRAGSEEVYAEAQRRADDLYVKVQQRRFEELGLNLVW